MVRSTIFLILLLLQACSYYIPFTDLPEHYSLAVKIWQANVKPGSKDTVLKSFYGWKSLETDTAIIISNKINVPAAGTYKIEIKVRWQNPNPSNRIIFEFAAWNGFITLQSHDESETGFEQNLRLNEGEYKLKLGVTNGMTPETESLIWTR